MWIICNKTAIYISAILFFVALRLHDTKVFPWSTVPSQSAWCCCVSWLTRIIRKVRHTGQALVIGWTGHWSSPCDWLWGIVLPIYKGKGSKYGCSSYSPGHHRPLCCGQSILLTRIKPHLQPGRREQSEFTHHGCVVARSIMERITHHGYDGLTLGKEVLQIRTSLMIWLLCLRRLKSCSWAWSRPPVASAMYLQQFPFSAVRLTSWIALYSIGANDQDV